MTNANTASNSVLASIFVLSLLMMFLIPFTLCGTVRCSGVACG
jgi:hypothetical protein